MKIGIIGAGFTGLAAAYQLVKKGHEVIIFEKDAYPGGLAIGYKEAAWEWTLEKHYHHWFTNDTFVLDLAKEIGYEVFIKRPTTSVYVDAISYQLDSPIKVLQFSKLSLIERLRMAGVLGFLRFDPFWRPLEKIKATQFLSKAMGKKAYEMIWEPQLKNKFGKYADEISLAWFWARIVKRTPSLAYPHGGFLQFANAVVADIKKKGGTFFFDTEVLKLESNGKIRLETKKRSYTFDKVIVTLPSFAFLKIVPTLPLEYQKNLSILKGLGAINMVLRLKKEFLQDGTYWLSICEKNSPVMAVVEHTNFMDKKQYDNEHLVYLGNYVAFDHKYFGMSDEKLFQTFTPFLQKINCDFKKSLIDYKVFRVPFAQPIIPLNYSKIMPPFDTPLKNVYLANIQQVYPWDRGTNYAVELGEKIAIIIDRNEK